MPVARGLERRRRRPRHGPYIPGVGGPGADVRQTFTYTLHAESDSAGVWLYHDHSPSMDGSITGRARVRRQHPDLHRRFGDVVQWDVLAPGDDIHSFHVHAHRWLTADGPHDVQTVSPAQWFEFRWKAGDPGTWLYHCHVEAHMMNGMIGLYRVSN